MTTFPTIANPSLQMPTELDDPSLSSDTINGMTITRAKFTRIRRSWQLHWNALLDSELATLLTFYDTVKGGSAYFTWSDEFGNTYSVRFVGKIGHNSVLDNRSAVSFKLKEV
jgi:hypothetical protein